MIERKMGIVIGRITQVKRKKMHPIMKRKETILVKRNLKVLEKKGKTEMSGIVNQKNLTQFFMANPWRAKERNWTNMSEVCLVKNKELETNFLGRRWKLIRDTLINHRYIKTMKTNDIKMVIMIIGIRVTVTRILDSGMETGDKVQDCLKRREI